MITPEPITKSASNIVANPSASLVLKLRPVFDLTDDEFFAICQLNRELALERTATGGLMIMSPVGGETGSRNSRLNARLYIWTIQDATGVSFDSSTGFNLPNGATRSPDAAWVRRVRLVHLTQEEKRKFLPLCPDFVVELRSPSDQLSSIQAKMREYIDNGAQLGWLLDPTELKVHIYRPATAPVILTNPSSVLGDPELPGFILKMAEIWHPGF